MSFYLGMIYKIFGFYPIIARFITAILSTLIVAMIYLLSSELFDEKVATISSLVAAFYAYLIFYGVTLVTETPFILCLLIVLYLSYKTVQAPSRAKWISLGILHGFSRAFPNGFHFFCPIFIGLDFTQTTCKKILRYCSNYYNNFNAGTVYGKELFLVGEIYGIRVPIWSRFLER